MASFKFNFQINDASLEHSNSSSSNEADCAVSETPNENLEPLEQIFILPRHEQVASSYNLSNEILHILLPNKDERAKLYYIPAAAVEKKLIQENNDESQVLKAHAQDSDLLPGVYEGGLKVWECSIDLLLYLNESNLDFEGLKILELGCGAGLPGIFCFIQGGFVSFQDYNKEVIDLLTIPNVIINSNCKEGTRNVNNCTFFSGDWANFISSSSNLQENDKYDLILTSETIYNLKNYGSLYAIFKCALKKTGAIYVAAKSCYFGVGGSMKQFKDFLLEKEEFQIETCKVTDHGVRKEICKVFKKTT